MTGFPIHGDLALSADGHRFVLRQGIEEYADRVRVALQIFQGTWWYDQRAGLRFLNEILEKPADKALELLRSEVRRVLSRVPGTERVLSVATDYTNATRTVELTWKVQSKYGVVTGTTEIA